MPPFTIAAPSSYVVGVSQPTHTPLLDMHPNVVMGFECVKEADRNAIRRLDSIMSETLSGSLKVECSNLRH